jgi:cyclic 2,3-diphosphoglycerate synthetase
VTAEARALAVIDGEHYAPVVRDALAELPYSFAGALMVGGSEKLRGGEDYGVPLFHELGEALAGCAPAVVVDLSDEPVLGPRERLLLASRVLAAGLPYVGADFRFDPPVFAPFALPSIGIAGTGKRVGKTAVSGHVARLLAAEHDLVVVAMGRGGPPEPELAERPPDLGDLLALSRAGRHAASDYLEDAALAQVVTVGARRAGGGLAGQPFASNVAEAAALAAARTPELVLFEGSGSALPPIATRRRILVVSARQDPALVTGYLNAYRLLVSDLVVLTNADDSAVAAAHRAAIAEVAPALRVVATVLRPRPVTPIEGKRVTVFTTAPEDAHPAIAEALASEYGGRVQHVSGSLARRPELQAELERIDADVLAVELKAAAVDVVAEAADAKGIELVLLDNAVVPLPGEELDGALRALALEALAQEVPA